MPVQEAIILAGGLGTRLRSAVPDLPKCMAPVNGLPFVHYVIRHLQSKGIQQFIFALGYKHEAFFDFLQQALPNGNYTYTIEETPLGTGGGIRLACSKASTETVLVTNGDTLFRGEIAPLYAQHQAKHASCTLSLKPMQDFDRYGVVETNAQGKVTAFKEKQYYAAGQINAGMYLLQRRDWLQLPFPEKFSFEKDYLETYCGQSAIYGLAQDAYFIDIGIPEDFQRAQTELIPYA